MFRERNILEQMIHCRQIISLELTMLDDDNFYFVMEYASRGTLDMLTKSVKPLPKRTCQWLLADIILGLEALH